MSPKTFTKYRILILKTWRSVWRAQLWITFSGNLQTQERCQAIFAAAAFRCLLFFPDSPVIEESVLELFVAHSVTVKTKHTTSIKGAFQGKASGQSHMVQRWYWGDRGRESDDGESQWLRYDQNLCERRHAESEKWLWLGFWQSLPQLC